MVTPHEPLERGQQLLNLEARRAPDVTQRVGFEDTLRRSEAQFRQLADAMPQIAWTATADGVIDYSNARWYQFTDSSVGVENEGWRDIVHPDDMPPASAQWAECVRSGQPFEMEIRLLDRRRSCYRWHLMRTVPVRDDAGVVVHWYGTATDINEQKRAEETARFLAESSAALATLVDPESALQKIANLAIPYFADWSAVDVAGEDGSLRRLAVRHQDVEKVEVVQELFRRYPPAPDEPAGIGRVFRTGEPEIVENITDEMLATGARDEEHLRLMRSLGVRSYICVPLIVAGKTFGTLTFAMAESGRSYTGSDLSLAQDLSHRAAVAIQNARLYQALLEEDRGKTEFLSLLAHELRNPLAPLRNGLEVMRLASNDRQSIEEVRSMMERQLHHLVRLVDDLLDVSRISQGKIELRKERVTLASIVDSTLETCEPILKQQNDELTVTLPEGPVHMDADKTRLAQALCNLVTNAAKYSDPGSHIWLAVEREGNQAVIRVKDSGVGIPAHMLPKVFDLFTQVDRSLEKSQGGLGVGLTIVRRLVEMHGGSVEAHSAGCGMGSEFVVRLPIELPVISQPEEQFYAPQPRQTVGHRILVADDNRDAARSLGMLLKMMGHEVCAVHDGLTAVEAAAGFRPDVVLLDIGMPRLNGYDTARRIREEDWGKNLVLVALTGWGQAQDRQQSREAGFNFHIVKPIEPVALEELLARLPVTA